MLNKEEYLALMAKYPKAFDNPENPSDGIQIIKDATEIEALERRLAGNNSDSSQVGIAYKDKYITLLRDAVTFPPNGQPGTYIRRFIPNEISGVAILPVYNDEVCLISIFRHALRKFVLEIPRGFYESGASAEENAKRELFEEIKGVPSALYAIGDMTENSGLSNAVTKLFFARVESVGDGQAEEGIKQVKKVPLKDFFGMLKSGEINDSFTLCAAARAVLCGYIATS